MVDGVKCGRKSEWWIAEGGSRVEWSACIVVEVPVRGVGLVETWV